jgi:hypothetical protein
MDNPYRVHSSIGFGFLQLLLLSSLATPTPTPPLYHNIALTRLMGTVYFTLFRDKPIYLKLECVTILLDVICDALYIRYIIQDYTYLFGVFDIIGNLLFCVVIVLSFENGENRWSEISEIFEGIRRTCFICCCGGDGGGDGGNSGDGGGDHDAAARARHPMIGRRDIYTSLSSDADDEAAAPCSIGGSGQAFKPSFYSSQWGREYLNAKVEREFERIDHSRDVYGRDNKDIGVISGAHGPTEYIRFDSTGAGANHYANLFVSPYFSKDGTPITSFSGWTKDDSVGVCLFIYNLVQFIYQLMMYSSIVASCREHHFAANATTTPDILMDWLC